MSRVKITVDTAPLGQIEIGGVLLNVMPATYGMTKKAFVKGDDDTTVFERLIPQILRTIDGEPVDIDVDDLPVGVVKEIAEIAQRGSDKKKFPTSSVISSSVDSSAEIPTTCPPRLPEVSSQNLPPNGFGGPTVSA